MKNAWHRYSDDPKYAHLGTNTIGGNPDTFYPELWKWIVDRFMVNHVLDVGCGEGHALEYFKACGCRVSGLDGLIENVSLAQDRCRNLDGSSDIVTHDICESPLVVRGGGFFDLVWCCEVVGQIDPASVKNVIQTLTQGRVLAMTNETPKQSRALAKNLQEPEYWTRLIEAEGMKYDAALTEESKQYGHHYWTATGRIYVRS